MLAKGALRFRRDVIQQRGVHRTTVKLSDAHVLNTKTVELLLRGRCKESVLRSLVWTNKQLHSPKGRISQTRHVVAFGRQQHVRLLPVIVLRRSYATDTEKEDEDEGEGKGDKEKKEDEDEEDYDDVDEYHLTDLEKRMLRRKRPLTLQDHPWQKDKTQDPLFVPRTIKTFHFVPPDAHSGATKSFKELEATEVNRKWLVQKMLMDNTWQRRRYMWYLIFAFISALCFIELYKQIYGEDDWVAYLAFVPVLNWFLYVQMAQIPKEIVLIPVTVSLIRGILGKLVNLTGQAIFFKMSPLFTPVVIGALFYRYYKLAEHFDVKPLQAAIAGLICPPLLLTLMACNASTYRIVSEDKPPRPEWDRVSLYQFFLNAGERSLRAVETGTDTTWIAPFFATFYLIMRPYMPGFSDYVKRSREVGMLIAAGELPPDAIPSQKRL